MMGKKILRLLVLWLALAVAGCADGVLFQKQREDGGVHRLRLDSAEGWSEFDTTPRYRSEKKKDQDGYGIVMKNEATF
ncbi:MAG: hypothetical protein NTW80_12170 [Deltaproteobacteria bacterium]|nr:hypothetical protein [Deltaproteobacteria bacterium]